MPCDYLICDPYTRGLVVGFLAGVGVFWFGLLMMKIGWDASRPSRSGRF